MSRLALRAGMVAASLLCVPVASHAALLDVVVTTRITAADFTINVDDVFGVAPGDFDYSVTIRVDTTAGPPVFAPAGAPTNVGGNPFTFGHDFWGYSVVSATATFGSKTWDDGDIVLLNTGDGIADSNLFVDTELVGGATPGRLSFRLLDADGDLFIGTRSCGVTCDINVNFSLTDFNGVQFNPDSDRISTSNYSIEVRAVATPAPAALALVATGLLLAAASTRRARA